MDFKVQEKQLVLLNLLIYKKESKKKILLVSADIYRPAAQEQLKILR